MILALCSLALAGLDDGWRGIPYGDASVLATAPTADCVKAPDVGVAWACTEKVGTATVLVSYMVDEGFYEGVYIVCKGYTTCQTLRETVGVAWRASPFTFRWPSKTTDMDDGYWNLTTGNVGAAWAYDDVTNEGSIATMDRKVEVVIAARKEARAREAAKGL